MKSSLVLSVFVAGALPASLLAQFTWTQVAGNGPAARAVDRTTELGFRPR